MPAYGQPDGGGAGGGISSHHTLHLGALALHAIHLAVASLSAMYFLLLPLLTQPAGSDDTGHLVVQMDHCLPAVAIRALR